MSWSYNQIDIYFMTQDLPLFNEAFCNVNLVPSVTNERFWNAASTYGIVRGRPSITLSSMNSQGTTIPGRNGTIYPSSSTRGNATLQFDILVENSWVHKAARNGTVASRADILATLIRDSKYISYKMPGVPADFCFKVTRKSDVTVTNADENAAVIQAKLEIKPFKYKFTGLKPIEIQPSTQTNINVQYPNGVCKPLLWFRTSNSGYVTYRGEAQVIVANQVVENTILDTEDCLCYKFDANDKPVSQNDRFKGDYRKLWIPKIDPEDIDGGQEWTRAVSIWQNIGLIYYYTKEGVDL